MDAYKHRSEPMNHYSPRFQYAVLFLILITALLLRCLGIEWGLPNSSEYYNSLYEDEWRVLQSVLDIDFRHGELLPKQVIYATANIYLYALLLETADFCGLVSYEHEMDYYVRNPQQLTRVYLLGRLVTVWYSLLSIIVLFLIGKSWFSPSIGLVAAALYAVIPVHVIESHYVKNTVPVTFWLLLLTLLSRNLLFIPTLKNHCFAGIVWGIALATQYNAGLFLLPLICLPLLRPRQKPARFQFPIDRYLLCLAIIAMITFCCFSPSSFFIEQKPGSDLRTIGKAFIRDRFYTYPFPPLSYYFMHLLPYALGFPLVVTGLLSVFLLLKRKQDWFLFIIFVSIASTSFITNLKVIRYVLFYAPFLCLFAARFFAAKTAYIPGRWFRQVLFFITISTATLLSFIYLDLMHQIDPRLQADAWIKRTLLPQYKFITLHEFRGLYPPLFDPLIRDSLGVTVFEDAMRYPELLIPCEHPVVCVDIEIYGIHNKYNKFKENYSEHHNTVTPLTTSDCYVLCKEFRNKPMWLCKYLTSHWLPLDLWMINPSVLIFLPTQKAISLCQ